MKYLAPHLQEKYEYYKKANPNIPEIGKPLMNISDILRAYFILADYFTDPTADAEIEPMLVEVLHMDMLISAITRQTAAFGNVEKYKDPLHICATLFYGLVKNHCFVDGNKRTALLTLLYQLDQYSYIPNANVRLFEKLTVAVAANSLEKDFIKEWRKSKQIKDETDRRVETIFRCIKENTKKKDNSFHIDITADEIVAAIRKIPGCNCYIDGTKIKMERIIERKFGIFTMKKETKYFSIAYRGKTRTIGASTLRDALSHLELLEQYSDYHSFIEGEDPRYMLIDQFEGPLRRLKDK